MTFLVEFSDAIRPWMMGAVKAGLILSGVAFLALIVIAADRPQFTDKTEADEE